MNEKVKMTWQGKIVAVQPRIRLTRSYDERQHTYLGYVLGIHGTLGSQPESSFLVAIGPKAHEEHKAQVGDHVAGASAPVADPELETAGYYKTSELQILAHAQSSGPGEKGPPFHALAPSLETYRAKGHRRLDARTYAAKCTTCVWGCKMPVEIIIDHWNRSRASDNVKRRFETFCYGPKDCSAYSAGPVRKVQGRKKWMVHEDDGDSTGQHSGDTVGQQWE